MNDEMSRFATHVVHRAEVRAGDVLFVRVPQNTPRAQAEALRHHLERNLPRAVRVVVLATETLDVTFGRPDWVWEQVRALGTAMEALDRQVQEMAAALARLEQRLPEPKRHVGDHSLDAADEVPGADESAVDLAFAPGDAVYVRAGKPVPIGDQGPLLPQPVVVKTRPVCGKEIARFGTSVARCLRPPEHEGDCDPEAPWPT